MTSLSESSEPLLDGRRGRAALGVGESALLILPRLCWAQITHQPMGHSRTPPLSRHPDAASPKPAGGRNLQVALQVGHCITTSA